METAREGLADAQQQVRERETEIGLRRQALERKGRRIEELEQVAARLAERVVERERELRHVREELEAARTQGGEAMRALATLAEDVERIRRQARGQATRIRMCALREAAEVTERAGQLIERPTEAERLIDALEEAISRLGAEEEPEEGPVEPSGSGAAMNGHAKREAAELFEGLVEVEVGPLRDFSQLVGFEDAANGIGATSEISVKRFKQGRATLAVRLKQPVELLRELEERAPFEFKVRDTRSDRVVLDVDGD